MKKSFETGMSELTTLIEALEGGQHSLDESFKTYERAVKLSKALREQLSEGEKRIEALREDLTREDISGEVQP